MNAEQIRLHKVYHGSGADFDAFDHSHMGDGEGNQSYGWGSYVTEVEGIGRTYAESNAKNAAGLNDARWRRSNAQDKYLYDIDARNRIETENEEYKELIERNRQEIEKLEKERAVLLEKNGEQSVEVSNWDFYNQDRISELRRDIERSEDRISNNQEYLNQIARELPGLKAEYEDAIKEVERLEKETQRYLYTVEIPDEVEATYLDYADRMGSHQDVLDSVDSALAADGWRRQEIDNRIELTKGDKRIILTTNQSGADLYAELESAFGSDKEASKFLHDVVGVTGIKYPAEYRSGGRADGKKNYVVFDEKDLRITDKLRFFRTPNGEAYGFTLNGVIHIDPRIATSETPIHEYSHLWVDAMRKSNPEEWEHIKKMLRAERAGKLGEIWRQVSENYPELEGNDDALCEEILTHYSGKRGAERLEAEVRRVADSDASPLEKSTVIAGLRRLGEGIRRFWKWVADSFHIHYKDVDEVADRIMSDLAEGKNFKDVKEKEPPVFYSNAERAVEGISQEKATPEQWLKMIEKGGGLKAGEDKWLGLSDWLRERSAAMESQPTKKTITKQEVLDFIRENQVHVEEVNYTERREFNDNGEVVSDAPIDSTRLEYTTEGLDNKREIALTVPTIEPYNESDNIHFGDAGGGRAVAWVRFGETTDADGKRVLVIDEIQSKRHQDGREKGYQREMTDEERAEFNSLGKEYQATVPALKEKYGPDITDTFRRRWNELTDEDRNSLIRAEEIVSRQHELAEITNGVPEAPFEKNWHELAMKRMLRYAAENGYDKIAWTTGEQQAERYNIGDVVDKDLAELVEAGKLTATTDFSFVKEPRGLYS